MSFNASGPVYPPGGVRIEDERFVPAFPQVVGELCVDSLCDVQIGQADRVECIEQREIGVAVVVLDDVLVPTDR
jgi:aromatic ring hydroxylase